MGTTQCHIIVWTNQDLVTLESIYRLWVVCFCFQAAINQTRSNRIGVKDAQKGRHIAGRLKTELINCGGGVFTNHHKHIRTFGENKDTHV